MCVPRWFMYVFLQKIHRSICTKCKRKVSTADVQCKFSPRPIDQKRRLPRATKVMTRKINEMSAPSCESEQNRHLNLKTEALEDSDHEGV